MTLKDDPTISYSHLMVETGVLAGRKNAHFGRRRLNLPGQVYKIKQCVHFIRQKVMHAYSKF